MTKELELLGKMDLTEENRAKLQALLEESKKTGKVASKKLVETLDAVDATEEQTEKFYDVLETGGVEIDVSAPGICTVCSTRISITGSPCVCIRVQSGSRERKKKLPFKRRWSVLP